MSSVVSAENALLLAVIGLVLKSFIELVKEMRKPSNHMMNSTISAITNAIDTRLVSIEGEIITSRENYHKFGDRMNEILLKLAERIARLEALEERRKS